MARSLMEAMASGLPCVASQIRGNTDLLDRVELGCLANSTEEYSSVINRILADSILKSEMQEYNLNRIKVFSMEAVISEMIRVYTQELL